MSKAEDIKFTREILTSIIESNGRKKLEAIGLAWTLKPIKSDQDVRDDLDEWLDDLDGPHIDHLQALLPLVEEWRQQDLMPSEWLVYIFLSLALQYALGAPTLSQALGPFLVAVETVNQFVIEGPPLHNPNWRELYWNGDRQTTTKRQSSLGKKWEKSQRKHLAQEHVIDVLDGVPVLP